ncbi:hypothetical protein ACFLTW_01125, partial [Chloroflexota bacterium]
ALAYSITPGPAWQYPETAADPKIKEFRDRVFIEPERATLLDMAPDLSGERPRQPKKVPTTVEVTTHGKVYSAHADFAKGDPPQWVEGMALSDAEIIQKFRNQAVGVAEVSGKWSEQVEDAIKIIMNLENLKDINELTRLLAFRV